MDVGQFHAMAVPLEFRWAQPVYPFTIVIPAFDTGTDTTLYYRGKP